MKPIQDYFVPWVKGIPMYVSAHIELAWRQPELHRMMSNENPNPPSKKVQEAIQKYGAMANRYPDQGLVVRSKIAEINGLDGPGNVMIGNGSSEVFDNIFRCFLQVGEEVIQHTPCFGIYKLRCNILGGKLVSVPMIYEDKELKFDVDAILAAITEKTKIIVVANPNNPTGTIVNKVYLDHLLEAIPSTSWVILDEAYAEFSDYNTLPDRVRLIQEGKRLISVRTFSKAYGLAGARLGYAIADEKIITAINTVSEPFNANRIAIAGALASIRDDQSTMQDTIAKIKKERFKTEEHLKRMGLRVIPSHANFVLFEVPFDADEVCDELLQQGIILRSCSAWGYDHAIRVTIGMTHEMEVFRKALENTLNMLEQKKGR